MDTYNENLERAQQDIQFVLLIQDSFLIQHTLEPSSGENVLDLVLCSQNELVDNVKIHESLGNSDHDEIHFHIKVNLPCNCCSFDISPEP